MSLIETSTLEITKRQYRYKLNANFGIFTALLFTQMIALLFSFAGSGNSGYGIGDLSINIKYITGNIVIFFTMIWGFTTGLSLTTKLIKDGDFAFVTNRLTSNLSSIALLLTASVIGGITAMLAGSLLRVIFYFFVTDPGMLQYSYGMTFSELIVGVMATVFYVSLLATLGYTVGTVVQLHKMFLLVLPALFFGLLFVEVRTQGSGLLATVFQFFAMETSFILFALKATVTMAIMYFFCINISNRMEVRR